MAEIKKINSIEEFLEFTRNSSCLNVVKLGANWCGPCKVLESILQGLTTEETEGVLLAEVDIDEEWFEEKADGLKIRGIPVVIAFKDGEEKERLVGGTTKDKLIEFFGRNK